MPARERIARVRGGEDFLNLADYERRTRSGHAIGDNAAFVVAECEHSRSREDAPRTVERAVFDLGSW